MKRITLPIVCVMACLAWSCAPVITSNIVHTSQPVGTVDDVVVFQENEFLPGDAEWVGTVDVQGRSTREQLLQITKNEAWKNGARYVKISDLRKTGPNQEILSISSDLYRSDRYDLIEVSRPLETQTEASSTIMISPDKNLYLIAGGNVSMVNSMGVEQNKFGVTLGAGYFVAPKFSIELAGLFQSSSIDGSDVLSSANTYMRGLGAAVVFHQSLKGHLTYIPQVELEYMNYKQSGTTFDFAGIGFSPLSFEYRADYSDWAFQLSLGSLAVVYPLDSRFSGSTVGLSLNSVSFNIVKYFK